MKSFAATGQGCEIGHLAMVDRSPWNRGCFAAALLVSAVLACGTPPTETPDQPNIILFYVDDLGWADVGFNGSTFYETPAIDRLAAEGIVFRQAYANAPNCAPSRASLLTGLYPPRHKIYTVAPAARGHEQDRLLVPPRDVRELDESLPTLSEVLAASGYVNGYFGKWHLGDAGRLPTDRGFDTNVGGLRVGSPPGGHFSPYRNPTLPDGPEGEYLTDRLTGEALKFLDRQTDSPFFLFLAHYAVHTPIQAKDVITARYAEKEPSNGQDNPAYAAMVESVDESLARVVERVRALGLSENTLIIFYSDNGGFAGATSNSPLRGAKGMLYEGGIRVPLAMHWPGTIAPGQVTDTPVIGTDLFPTLVRLAGAQPPELLDGVDLWPLTAAEEIEDRPLFWHFPAYLEAGPGVDGLWRTTPAGAVRLGDYKLIEYFEDGRLELYNLTADIGESADLASVEVDRTEALARLMREWRVATAADMPTRRDP